MARITIKNDLRTLTRGQINRLFPLFWRILVQLAGKEAVRHLKRNAPRRTGRLANSAFFLVVGDSVHLGYGVFYSQFQRNAGKSAREFAASPRFEQHVRTAFDRAYRMVRGH